MKIKEFIEEKIQKKEEIWNEIKTKNFVFFITCDEEDMKNNDYVVIDIYENTETPRKQVFSEALEQDEIDKISQFDEEIVKIQNMN